MFNGTFISVAEIGLTMAKVTLVKIRIFDYKWYLLKKNCQWQHPGIQELYTGIKHYIIYNDKKYNWIF